MNTSVLIVVLQIVVILILLLKKTPSVDLLRKDFTILEKNLELLKSQTTIMLVKSNFDSTRISTLESVILQKHKVVSPDADNIDKLSLMKKDNSSYDPLILEGKSEEIIGPSPLGSDLDFLEKERSRLIQKLEKIEHLTRLALNRVRVDPDGVEEIIRQINFHSK